MAYKQRYSVWQSVIFDLSKKQPIIISDSYDHAHKLAFNEKNIDFCHIAIPQKIKYEDNEKVDVYYTVTPNGLIELNAIRPVNETFSLEDIENTQINEKMEKKTLSFKA